MHTAASPSGMAHPEQSSPPSSLSAHTHRFSSSDHPCPRGGRQRVLCCPQHGCTRRARGAAALRDVPTDRGRAAAQPARLCGRGPAPGKSMMGGERAGLCEDSRPPSHPWSRNAGRLRPRELCPLAAGPLRVGRRCVRVGAGPGNIHCERRGVLARYPPRMRVQPVAARTLQETASLSFMSPNRQCGQILFAEKK